MPARLLLSRGTIVALQKGVAPRVTGAENRIRMKFAPPLLLAALLLSGCPRPAPPDSAPPSQTPAEEKQAPAPPAVAVDPAAFAGTWATADEQGQEFEIVVFPDGQAVSTWVKGPSGVRGERGFWRTDGGRLIVFFQDGWTDVIAAQGETFLHRGFEPGADLTGKWKNEAPARKLEGDSFAGVWQLNKEPDGEYLYITLQSSGRAFSTISGGTEGKWEQTKDGALCTWPDGWNDLIYPSSDGYQKRSWVGTAEQNATPPDISPAVRVGSGKFSISP